MAVPCCLTLQEPCEFVVWKAKEASEAGSTVLLGGMKYEQTLLPGCVRYASALTSIVVHTPPSCPSSQVLWFWYKPQLQHHPSSRAPHPSVHSRERGSVVVPAHCLGAVPLLGNAQHLCRPQPSQPARG